MTEFMVLVQECNMSAKRCLVIVVNKALLVVLIMIGACSTTPLMPYTEDGPPLVLLPASQAGVLDKRGRFREIFCHVLEAGKAQLPDYRPCQDALTEVGAEAGKTGKSVNLGASDRRLLAVVVPGVGWECIEEWLDTKNSLRRHLRPFGYDLVFLKVDGLSGSTNNARQIRDAINAMKPAGDESEPNLVLIGYSKGAPDILEAVVSYPEIRNRVAAVVSAAGSVGGSPLANDATQSQVEMMRHWPGAQCSIGDSGALESLLPATRRAWLAENSLPDDFPYYSLVTYPKPERISSILQSSYNKLSKLDARNDGQVMFYDQVIPGSTLIAYVNADHWALAVPVARSHSMIGSVFVDKNDYPREALFEALLRFVEEDISVQVE